MSSSVNNTYSEYSKSFFSISLNLFNNLFLICFCEILNSSIFLFVVLCLLNNSFRSTFKQQGISLFESFYNSRHSLSFRCKVKSSNLFNWFFQIVWISSWLFCVVRLKELSVVLSKFLSSYFKSSFSWFSLFSILSIFKNNSSFVVKRTNKCNFFNCLNRAENLRC